MRPSKQRSRGKSNRNRNTNSNGNNLNRVFDSSGPEGKVRGTPQQIIDKYQALTRDAQLANDRVAEENFQQHAEHYVRLLGDATREAEARRLEQEAQHRERQAQRDARNENRNDTRQDNRSEGRTDNRSDGRNEARTENRSENRPDNRADNRNAERQADAPQQVAPITGPITGPADVIDPSDAPQPELPSFITDAPTTLVDTPEGAEKPAARKPRRRKPVAIDGEEGAVVEDTKPKPRRRAPKKVTEEAVSPDSPEAAE